MYEKSIYSWNGHFDNLRHLIITVLDFDIIDLDDLLQEFGYDEQIWNYFHMHIDMDRLTVEFYEKYNISIEYLIKFMVDKKVYENEEFMKYLKSYIK